ncbi:MAG: transketolase family protein [Solobacterium sp.]|nr:transketolase family protein [Solobacterium sp.]
MTEKKAIATRDSYGKALKELGDINPRVVVLDADLSGSTKSGVFAKAHPERFFNCGIAESNMMSIAAGLAASGLIPFASTFAMFAAGRPYEQIRNSIGYPHLNVKIVASHGGVSVGEDGASHQCNEDFALMREIPGMTVICPADDVETRAAVKAIAEHDGPVFMRTGRSAVPVVLPEDYHFEIGKAVILREGTDVTIAAVGLCVGAALEAADKLAEEGISAEVINVSTIKPLDEEKILQSVKKTGRIVTAEEHSIIGGLGSAVAECLCENYPAPLFRIGIRDVFGQSGTMKELLHLYKLDGEGIFEQVKTFLNK